MAKSKRVIPKKRRGRPATGKDPLTALRLPPELTRAIEAWAAQQGDEPNRSEAIRRLVELGLTVRPNDRPKGKGQKQRAREIAGGTIDELTDLSANPDDQANRKRHLLKGPEEFRRVRVDRPSRKT
ncbi:hypothetical protein CWO90_17585 [Bradyrhizobium sp. Leo121]|nr:hypothetical protein CWO90_17585 [Bradyrhizobium sp. Leo121]